MIVGKSIVHLDHKETDMVPDGVKLTEREFAELTWYVAQMMVTLTHDTLLNGYINKGKGLQEECAQFGSLDGCAEVLVSDELPSRDELETGQVPVINCDRETSIDLPASYGSMAEQAQAEQSRQAAQHKKAVDRQAERSEDDESTEDDGVTDGETV